MEQGEALSCSAPGDRGMECRVCGERVRGTGWREPLPGYLRKYQWKSEQCCSKRCLEKWVGAWPDILCVMCSEVIPDFSPSSAQELVCGHNYHMVCFCERIRAENLSDLGEKLRCLSCSGSGIPRHVADYNNVKNKSARFSAELLFPKKLGS